MCAKDTQASTESPRYCPLPGFTIFVFSCRYQYRHAGELCLDILISAQLITGIAKSNKFTSHWQPAGNQMQSWYRSTYHVLWSRKMDCSSHIWDQARQW